MTSGKGGGNWRTGRFGGGHRQGRSQGKSEPRAGGWIESRRLSLVPSLHSRPKGIFLLNNAVSEVNSIQVWCVKCVPERALWASYENNMEQGWHSVGREKNFSCLGSILSLLPSFLFNRWTVCEMTALTCLCLRPGLTHFARGLLQLFFSDDLWVRPWGKKVRS